MKLKILIFLLLLNFHNSLIADDCIKLVFNKYCLGGMTQNTNKITDKNIKIDTKDNIIIAVETMIKPANWLTYFDYSSRLNQKYGQGLDNSTFPNYAHSRNAKEKLIAFKKGYAKQLWQQQNFKIILDMG
ncbi:MAG: hypothetical protein DRQ51_00250 [Gammaproteobacteria bacterium]|nr:MAG: hypothetical protein DRQ51_00250 [Gammaproteobacteria bacterium]